MKKTVNLGDLFNDAMKKQPFIVHPSSKRKQHIRSNRSGFFGVQKIKCSECKKDHTWAYNIKTSNGKHKITRTDLLKLKKEVKSMGFKWLIIDEKKALKTAKEANVSLKLLR